MSRLCGAPAVGGTCVLPAGHNMGRLDIPQNHQAGTPLLRPVAWRYKAKEADRWALTDMEPWAETPFVEPLYVAAGE